MNREEWLKAAEKLMTPWIEAEGHEYPEKTRVACGWPKGGRQRIGECWSNADSADQTFEMFISPALADASRVCDILLHEMVHAALGIAAGHKKPFKDLATALGLEGKMTATVAGEALQARIAAEVLAVLPLYPHACLSAAEKAGKAKTYLVKAECPDCGYTVRTTQKWLDQVGAPICPCNDEPMGVSE